jgi:hypothetical protein
LCSARVPAISRIDLAERFLEFAFEILDVYRITGEELDYRQACEKGWAAIVQATMHARGSPITIAEFGKVVILLPSKN